MLFARLADWGGDSVTGAAGRGTDSHTRNEHQRWLRLLHKLELLVGPAPHCSAPRIYVPAGAAPYSTLDSPLLRSPMNFVLVLASATLTLAPLTVAVTRRSVPANSASEVSQQVSTQPCVAMDLEPAFPAFEFKRPVLITGAGDGSGRLFVVEQEGVIWTFDGTIASPGKKSVFLDISDQVSREGNEEGLLGLAFHPDFEANGRFFVHYSSSVHDKHGVLSSYRCSTEDESVADPDSESILLEVEQPWRNHNGGAIVFGPDGYLYMALGDGGAGGDPKGNGQDLSTLLGSILRIDVEGDGYSIPGDNPFVDVPEARPEIWAFGLRNVWRFSFDRATGKLWAGDVGQDKAEEVSIIERGGNYGWNSFEAFESYSDEPLSRGEHVEPIATYGRREGISITGGVVYRGERFPELEGAYLYADYVTGNMWSIREKDGEYVNTLARRTRTSISSFGEDDNGEVFVTSFDGRLYRIVPSDIPAGLFDDWPKKLSDTGIYASTKDKTLASNVIPYAVAAPFWSDGADKARYIQLPEGGTLTYTEEGAWDVPVGSTLVKEFFVEGKRRPSYLETRLSRRTEKGWAAATYVWTSTGRDARLAVDGKDAKFRSEKLGDERGRAVWHAPSAAQCNSCHVPSQGYALGLSTAQLNHQVDGSPQISALAEQGVVQLPQDFDASSALSFVDPHGEAADLETRARVWLDVNCAMCHQPEGKGNASIDLRYGTLLFATGLIDAEPTQGSLGITDARIVAPGDPDRSLLLHRIQTLGEGRMPNVGSHRVDERGVELIRSWVEGLGK